AVSSAQNIIKCCKRCNLDVSGMVLEQVASSEAVLSQDEKDIGVVLIDIGGGTTDMAIFIDGAITHTAVIPIGGDHLTSDLVNCLRTSAREADILKIRYGSCMVDLVPGDEQIDVPGVGGRESSPMSRQVMVQYLEARTLELLEYVKNELQRSGYEELVAAGLVITGGTSLLEGMVELAEQTFDGLPVRRGYPQGVDGLVDVVSSPIYATGVGLLLYGKNNQHTSAVAHSINEDHQGLWHKMRQWFGDTK
ncbi:MAG: cell division protein FtsA, partial [Mariprofundaceae bacterium]|nr:cell division protein FtsA [Mariprofundaceae bacterium]